MFEVILVMEPPKFFFTVALHILHIERMRKEIFTIRSVLHQENRTRYLLRRIRQLRMERGPIRRSVRSSNPEPPIERSVSCGLCIQRRQGFLKKKYVIYE